MPTNIEIRKKYLQLIEELQNDEQFIELTEMANRYNFGVKIMHEITYQRFEDGVSPDDIFTDFTILAFLYKNELLDEANWRSKKKQSNFVLLSKEKAEKIYELSQKFIYLYRKGLFSRLEEEIFNTQDVIEIKWKKSNTLSEDEILQMVGHGPFEWDDVVYNRIVFSIDGINIFYLGGNRYFTSDDVETFIKKANDKSYFINRVRSTTDLVNISELDCYSIVSDKCKKLIDSGNQYLNLFFFTKDTEVIDYSPLLLNFSKALEVEIKEYYDRHFSLIWPLADLVVSNSGLLLNAPPNKKHRFQRLVAICHEISRFKEQYHPSGHKSLPYILLYLGLGKDIEGIIDVKGFLEITDRDKVEKEITVIERLFDTSNSRNKYIHELVIESRNEFLMYYFDIIQTLNLLVSIK